MQHPRTLKNIISTIEAVADKDTALKCYEVHWSIINSREIGMVPQQRDRIYIVAIKLAGRASTTFAWPRPVAPADLSDIYDEPDKVPVSYSRYPMRGLSAPTSRKNINDAIAKVRLVAQREGKPAEALKAVVDIGSSRLNLGIGYSPCLTASRCSARAFVNLQTAEKLTVTEMMRLQGFTTEDISAMKISLSNSRMAKMVGNAFTKSVPTCIIRAAFKSA